MSVPSLNSILDDPRGALYRITYFTPVIYSDIHNRVTKPSRLFRRQTTVGCAIPQRRVSGKYLSRVPDGKDGKKRMATATSVVTGCRNAEMISFISGALISDGQ